MRTLSFVKANILILISVVTLVVSVTNLMITNNPRAVLGFSAGSWSLNGLGIETTATSISTFNGSTGSFWNSRGKNGVSDNTGGAIIAWYNSGTYIQRIDSTGNQLWGVGGTFQSSYFHNWLVPDGSGGAILVQDVGKRVQKINSSGIDQWGATGVALFPGAPSLSLLNIVAVEDGIGGVIVVGNSGSDIYAQRVTGAGSIAWGSSGVTVPLSGTIASSSITIDNDGSGGAAFTWIDGTSSYAQYIDASGTKQWGGTGILIHSSTNNDDPIIAHSNGGSFFVHFRDDITNVAYLQKISAAGVKQFSGLGQIIRNFVTGIHSAIIRDGSGGVLIESFGRIYRFDSSGSKLWEQSLFGSYKNIALSGDGNVIISGHSLCTGGSTWDIVAVKLRLSDGMTTSPHLCVATATSNQHFPKVISNGSNGAIIYWEDQRSGNTDLYAQNIKFNDYQIFGVPISSDIVRKNDLVSIKGTPYTSSTAPVNTVGETASSIELLIINDSTDFPIAEVSANLTLDRIWNGLIADRNSNTSIINNLLSSEGVNAATYTLFVQKAPSDNTVLICPNASSLGAVFVGCSGGYNLDTSSSDVTIETFSGQEFWKITNLTGNNGGQSYVSTVTPTPTPTLTNTPTITPTVTTTITVTPTPTATITPTGSVTHTPSPTVSTTISPSATPIPTSSIPPIDPGSASSVKAPTDLDSDKDGLTDKQEETLGTNPAMLDTDDDGLGDGFEYNNGTKAQPLDPNNSDSNNNSIDDSLEDYDKDGLTNSQEYFAKTIPTNPDTDGDGLLDGEEIQGCIYIQNSTECSELKFSPTDPNNPDTNGNGINDKDEQLITKDSPPFLSGNLDEESILLLTIRQFSQQLNYLILAGSLIFIFLHLLAYPNYLVYLLGQNKKKQKNTVLGLLIESGSNLPIKFSKLELTNSQGQKMATLFSDRYGRFCFEQPPIEYHLSLLDTNYKTRIITPRLTSTDLIMEAETEKTGRLLLIKQLRRLLAKTAPIFVFTILLLSTLILIVTNNWINVLATITSLMLVIAYRVLRTKYNGFIISNLDNRISGAIIKLSNSANKIEDLQSTDTEGRFNIFSKNTDFTLNLENSKYIVDGKNNKFEHIVPISETSLKLKISTGKQQFPIYLKLKQFEFDPELKLNPHQTSTKFGEL